MSDELKKVEIEIAKVRLAKEQLELRDAVNRAERRQRVSDGADRLIGAGRSVAQISAAAIAQRTFYGLAIVLFITYLAGLPESKSNALVVAFFASAALALYATVLLLKKLLQLVFSPS